MGENGRQEADRYEQEGREVGEIKLTDLFKAWIKQCERDIDTDDLDIDYDDSVSYQSVECEMRFELEDKPSWSSKQRAVITFENEHEHFTDQINYYHDLQDSLEELNDREV